MKKTKIAVIGGGIAGCSVAYALKRKGFEVTLYEKEKSLAAGTSGHPLAVFMPRLERSHNPYSDFYLAAYLFSLSLYERLEKEFGNIWHPARGCFQKAADEPEAARMATLENYFPELSEHLKFCPDRAGLVFPRGGCLVPENICIALTTGIEVVLGKEFSGDEKFDATVLATGPNSFDGWGENPFRLTRGQINYLPELKDFELLETLAFPGGYLTPKTKKGFHVLGTSFKVLIDPSKTDWETLSQENLDKNLATLGVAFPSLKDKWENPPLKGRVALRTETIDHLPVAGAAFDKDTYLKVYKEKQRLHHSQRQVENEADTPGLFVFSGFGSRGFMAAPYAAEILSSQMAGSPPPCTASITKALSPARFLLKDLKKGKIRAT
ncbi:MAG: FAD-dependent 5-carboxymethylaminomethyl-2-thiouridine(34) oxidoreductase MnmC [Sphingomonadales bacterium]